MNTISLQKSHREKSQSPQKFSHEFDTYDRLPLVGYGIKIISYLSPELHPILGDFIQKFGSMKPPEYWYLLTGELGLCQESVLAMRKWRR